MVGPNNRPDSGDGSSFRDRLARIPDAEGPGTESHGDWDNAAPPVVRRAAPVARPQPQRQQHQQQPQTYVDDVSQEPQPHQAQQAQPEPQFEPIGQRRRRKWPFVVGLLVIVLALLVLIPVFIARRTFDSVPRVPVAAQLTEPVPEGRNILLVGTDSREGIDDTTDNAGLILGEGISGERSDTILILRQEADGSKFLSLPRDLWLPINGGSEQRINTAIAQGPEALVNTVQSALGIPISHYVQVDLAGFIDVVDAIGGVEVTIENPAFDPGSGLDLPTAGTVTLDSTQALAWVRSRRYTEIIDGQEVVDGTSDLGRVARQQEFMRALLNKVLEQRNPVALNDLGGALSQAIALDEITTLTDALTIGNALRSGTPESVELPTFPDTRSGNSVLLLADGSGEVLRSFGAE